MKAKVLTDRVKARYGAAAGGTDSVVEITARPTDVPGVVASLKEAGFSYLNFVSARDLVKDHIELVYRLFSYEDGADAVVRVLLDRNKPEVQSICGIFRTAEWHERETAEMFGVNFTGHPCLKRLLLPEGVTAPLRKDFRHGDMTPLPT